MLYCWRYMAKPAISAFSQPLTYVKSHSVSGIKHTKNSVQLTLCQPDGVSGSLSTSGLAITWTWSLFRESGCPLMEKSCQKDAGCVELVSKTTTSWMPICLYTSPAHGNCMYACHNFWTLFNSSQSYCDLLLSACQLIMKLTNWLNLGVLMIPITQNRREYWLSE
jgi:hypothetical protein